ncbi:Cys-tRNA(Pro) deacylase [Halalkalibacter akibai]|uniref:Cys-tRNA(Pro)/Cys-tRNA(Cys) deacylase n=1 Tax=Halalkalibacter akibai (strain ATCC 43226 / DSM 21942 / CIP 109018 / JCM 9157 / 1139) TaxID=1236973 RepID=W4QV76_HALA3|nr:Cys-tRNA(Pro) deacylase [Halalkalibacter akibai]GAE35518.1 Cys-tRNA(Pro) deacylase YbaK [Halalkalibacter akibai JCM 9157]
MKKAKTNAMRMLDKKQVPYNMLSYSSDDGKIDGVSVSAKINKDVKLVYKTLVAQGASKTHYVFVVPVETELNLKKAAKAAVEKKIEMIPVKDITKITGYIRGGCSPIGMKKAYATFIDHSAELLEQIIVSGGMIGIQLELKSHDLANVTNAHFADLV